MSRMGFQRSCEPLSLPSPLQLFYIIQHVTFTRVTFGEGGGVHRFGEGETHSGPLKFQD